jgi:hypothetical protein
MTLAKGECGTNRKVDSVAPRPRMIYGAVFEKRLSKAEIRIMLDRLGFTIAARQRFQFAVTDSACAKIEQGQDTTLS